MFTGLIETVGTITALARTSGKLRLSLQAPFSPGDLALGDSIAVDGCCLTVVDLTGIAGAAKASTLAFDAAEETLRRTSLGRLKIGDAIHLERAMRVDARLDGHIVQGHIDCVGTLKSKRQDGDAVWLTFAVPENFTRYMVEKGAVALDGVSLTLTTVGKDACAVMLVPYTQEKTHLAKKALGAPVNIEVDVLAKYVERLLAAPKTGIDAATLKDNGFT